MAMAEVSTVAPLCLPPRPLGRPPRTQLPAGTCDCHFHVFREGLPLAEERGDTPTMATLADWHALAAAVGIACGVVVQPSVCGTDNRVLLAALAAHPDTLRGVVVIPPDTAPAEIARLHRLGVRAVRINLPARVGLALDAVPDLARLVRPFGWHLQFLVGPDRITTVADIAVRHAIPVVIDHLALIHPDDAGSEAAVTELQRLLDTGTAHVKVSAPYRLARAPGYPGLARLVERLVRSHPERLLWGTDWPHTDLYESVPDDADLVDTALDWFSDAGLRERVLVANPQALYWAA
jgi:predicted TIM-barrel fold metal-dependent hydrolase